MNKVLCHTITLPYNALLLWGACLNDANTSSMVCGANPHTKLILDPSLDGILSVLLETPYSYVVREQTSVSFTNPVLREFAWSRRHSQDYGTPLRTILQTRCQSTISLLYAWLNRTEALQYCTLIIGGLQRNWHHICLASPARDDQGLATLARDRPQREPLSAWRWQRIH